MHTHARNALPKIIPHAVVLPWLGVQAPTAEVHVVLDSEVPSKVDEGMYQ